MFLSEIKLNNAEVVKDGCFDVLAQSIVRLNRRILTFFDDLKYKDSILNNPSIHCVICKPEHINLFNNSNVGLMISDQPRLVFFELHNMLSNNEKFRIPDTINSIGQKCKISPYANLANKNIIIGDNVIIEDYVSIREHVIIGNNSIIRTGCCLGGQGYEFKRNNYENILTVNHAGNVIIKDNVELKEYCTVHKAVFSWDSTIIGEYSKIDAHVHIAHASKIGDRVMIGSHASISGNVNINQNVYIGPGAIISNRVVIGTGAKITIGSVVTKDVIENEIVTGNFAIEHNKFIMDLKKKLE